jgi:hypothetical protein
VAVLLPFRGLLLSTVAMVYGSLSAGTRHVLTRPFHLSAAGKHRGMRFLRRPKRISTLYLTEVLHDDDSDAA